MKVERSVAVKDAVRILLRRNERWEVEPSAAQEKNNEKIHEHFEIFGSFFDVFASFSRFSQVFGVARTYSDAFGYVRMHSDASGCVRTLSETFELF